MLKYSCTCNLSCMNDLGALQMYFVMDRCDNVGEFRCEIVGHIANIPHGYAPIYAKDAIGVQNPKCKVLDILQISNTLLSGFLSVAYLIHTFNDLVLTSPRISHLQTLWIGLKSLSSHWFYL